MATRRRAPHVRDQRSAARGPSVRPEPPASPTGTTGVGIGRVSTAPLPPPRSAPARAAAPGWSAWSCRCELGRGRAGRGDNAPRPRAGPSRQARSSAAGRGRRAIRRGRAPAASVGSGVRRSRGSAVSTHAGGGGTRSASGRRPERGCVVACASRFSVRPSRPGSIAPSALDQRVVEHRGVVVLARDDDDLVPGARMHDPLVVDLGPEALRVNRRQRVADPVPAALPSLPRMTATSSRVSSKSSAATNSTSGCCGEPPLRNATTYLRSRPQAFSRIVSPSPICTAPSGRVVPMNTR